MENNYMNHLEHVQQLTGPRFWAIFLDQSAVPVSCWTAFG